jgi:hypothetical protein
VTLKTALASPAEGVATAEILATFPTLSEDDVPAAIAFSARCRRRRISPLPTCQPNGEKSKLDENLPERLVPELAALGHDVDTVGAEHVKGQPDPRSESSAVG